MINKVMVYTDNGKTVVVTGNNKEAKAHHIIPATPRGAKRVDRLARIHSNLARKGTPMRPFYGGKVGYVLTL